jgi:hypothetical protein
MYQICRNPYFQRYGEQQHAIWSRDENPGTSPFYISLIITAQGRLPCIDSKQNIIYIHIYGSKRNALLLTVTEVYIRKTLTHIMEFNIRKIEGRYM